LKRATTLRIPLKPLLAIPFVMRFYSYLIINIFVFKSIN